MSAVIGELVSLQVMVWMLADRYTHPLIFHVTEKKKREKSRSSSRPDPAFFLTRDRWLQFLNVEVNMNSKAILSVL